MTHKSTFLFLAAAAVRIALADHETCGGQYPIYVDIHNRTITGATSQFQYGSFIGVAVPYQNQSLWPSLRRNETSFASRDFCRESNLTDCDNATGGSVDFAASSTWREIKDYTSKDTDSIGNTSVFGTDDVHLWTHFFDPGPATGTNVTNMPVEYVLGGDVSPGVVGLGSASTLLQSLVDQKLISAKTYSLYIGTGMERAGNDVRTMINGSHTFGGYDAGRITGNIHTYDMDLSQADYLPVTVADIIIEDAANGISNQSLLDNTTFEARITTDQYPMLLPSKATSTFKALLSAIKSSSPDNSLRTTRSFAGTMRMILSDGFEITLPSTVISNKDNLTPIQDNTDTDDNATSTGPFYLSTAWLSQVYLTLDFEARKFHLAQVLQDGKYIIPMALCANDTPVPHSYGAANSAFVREGMIGAVIGGVLGGTAILVAMFAGWVYWKRQQYGKEQDRRWAAGAAGWKRVGEGEMEMESLTPVGRKARLPWAREKKKGRAGLGGETMYQGKNLSTDSMDS